MKQQYERAKLAGLTARQNGRKRDANPYANKPALRVLADAWLSGWIEADRLNRGGSDV